MEKFEHDIWDGDGNALHVTTTFYGGGIGMTISGYGNTSVVGEAEIVYLDWFMGKLQVVIHNDHANDDPMTIDLETAHHVYQDETE